MKIEEQIGEEITKHILSEQDFDECISEIVNIMRLQIEKDRERLEPLMTIARDCKVVSNKQFGWIASEGDHIHVNSEWRNAPIILD